MHIKRFIGATVKDAMKAVKAEFNENALILSTNRMKDSQMYEVIAAVDYDLSKPVELNLNQLKKIEANPKEPQAGLKTGPEPKRSEMENTLRKELNELKEFCWKMINASDTGLSRVYSMLESEMIKGGVDKRLVQKILMKLSRDMGSDRPRDIGFMKEYLRKKVSENIKINDPLATRGAVAFIGPTGVGKTTTIAKLSAIQALKKKKRVALVTMDTYRIAAVEQLKVYARIIGVPVEVVRDTVELKDTLGRHRDKDLVLIDTAGRSRNNEAHMRELSELGGMGGSLKFNLVLSAQTRDESLYDNLRTFSRVPVDSITFTKLDESRMHGQLLNIMVLAKKPVSYLSTGQRVPEDIELATKDRLLELTLNM